MRRDSRRELSGSRSIEELFAYELAVLHRVQSHFLHESTLICRLNGDLVVVIDRKLVLTHERSIIVRVPITNYPKIRRKSAMDSLKNRASDSLEVIGLPWDLRDPISASKSFAARHLR